MDQDEETKDLKDEAKPAPWTEERHKTIHKLVVTQHSARPNNQDVANTVVTQLTLAEHNDLRTLAHTA